MSNIKSFSVAGLCALLLSGCANYQSPQEQSGMVIGGVLGGVLGSQVGRGDGRTAAIILGSLAGAQLSDRVADQVGPATQALPRTPRRARTAKGIVMKPRQILFHDAVRPIIDPLVQGEIA